VGVNPERHSSRHARPIDFSLVASPETKIKRLLISAKREDFWDQIPFVSTVIFRWPHPHPTLPHRGPSRGEGYLWQRGSELPKKIVLAIERYHTIACLE
jgi:hypothetical protein